MVRFDDGLTDLSAEELEPLMAAAQEIRTCERALAKTGDTVLTELLRGHGSVQDRRHYPPGDVYDVEFHAQFYYHCHPVEERKPGEHGHFHTFMRPFGMPAGVKPAALADFRPPDHANDALSHLIGVGMSSTGQVIRLFTTNRWVTGECWYRAEDVIAMLDGFVIEHTRPSWPLNRWMTAVVRLFRPQIVGLLRQRDRALASRAEAFPDANPYEDRYLEVPSEIEVSAAVVIDAVERAWRQTRRRSTGQAPNAESGCESAGCQSVSSALT